MDELARAVLPMVYNLVWRALDGDADVDDVVQDVMVRAFRQLGSLRSVESFRPWLTSIAMHQIGTHAAREDRASRRTAPLEVATDLPDAGAEMEGPALLRTDLAGQRRQVRHAVRWMVPDDRAVFSLWCLESLDELSRAELAAALGIDLAHAGVRVQRMRDQLERSRAVVAALEAMPGCARLEVVVAKWDGTPSPFWRKRIARHIRSCSLCSQVTVDHVTIERLLAGLALLPVPAALTTALIVKEALAGAGVVASSGAATAGFKAAAWAGRAVHAIQAIGAHPIIATVVAGSMAVGIAATSTDWSDPAPRAGAFTAASGVRSGNGSFPATVLPAGRWSLESAGSSGQFIAVAGDSGVLEPAQDIPTRRRATFRVVAGLADPACSSFVSSDGRFLRHSSFRLRPDSDEGTVLFRRDATFCAQQGFLPGSVALESLNFRGFFVRHIGGELWIDQFDGSAGFRADASFLVRPPLD